MDTIIQLRFVLVLVMSEKRLEKKSDIEQMR
jgi:hypothetical protein